MLLPTQVSTLLQSTIIVHAYYKQNTPFFLSWFAVYTCSLLQHFTKGYFPVWERERRLIPKIDAFFCCIMYCAVLYDFLVRSSIESPYAEICSVVYGLLPVYYIGSAITKRFIWHPDFLTAEWWHVLFHVVAYADAHLYLYNS